ncbi:MAG: RIP metalloprotease RseP [Bacteroidales bacterium]|jgi:regulator of sigma E protease|nr:RIP metalloprotease RseP [Bacteroidales bacterium]
MNTLIMAAQLILGISILVLLHEFGHYIAARAFGIRVEKFFLFFDAWGFKLISFKIGETEYGIGWLPLGGYVKISGMIDESLDKAQLAEEPQPYEFRSKPAWQRLIVMVGGVLVNLILGIIIFTFVLLQYEKSYLPVEEVNAYGVYASPSGTDAGFRSGDKIIGIDGNKIERFKDAQSVKLMFGGDVQVDRSGQTLDVVIPENFYKKEAGNLRQRFLESYNVPLIVEEVSQGYPAEKAGIISGDQIISLDSISVKSYGVFREIIHGFAGQSVPLNVIRGQDTVQLVVDIDSTAFIGISAHMPYELKNYTIGSALKYGYKDAIDMLVVNIKGLGKVFSGEEKATESIQGPIGIARIYGAEWVWSKFWFITGLLSLILAFMNILPIPALDGGHVLFLMFEIITRRKPSDKFLEYAQIAGMIILMAIMVFAVGNDIFKLFR